MGLLYYFLRFAHCPCCCLLLTSMYNTSTWAVIADLLIGLRYITCRVTSVHRKFWLAYQKAQGLIPGLAIMWHRLWHRCVTSLCDIVMWRRCVSHYVTSLCVSLCGSGYVTSLRVPLYDIVVCSIMWHRHVTSLWVPLCDTHHPRA